MFLGWDQHYMIKKITDPATIDKTYFLISATAILLPLSMIIWAKIFRIDTKRDYNLYLEKQTTVDSEKTIFVV
ncbi:MAG: oligosaccharide repeat unit polymerase, partial [Clostridium sp.]